MNLTLKQLEAFIWVADLGNFRRAAERLNTSQPNISMRISSLESALDVKLLERDAGSVALTTHGNRLLEHARKVIRQTEALISATRNTALYEGTIRLGATELVAHTWLRTFLKEINVSYPNLSIELTIDLSSNLNKSLFDHSIDLAFQNGPFNRKTTGSTDLGTYPWIWIGSRQLTSLVNQAISTEQLAKHTLLTHSRDTQTFSELQSHFAKHANSTPQLVPSSSLAACLHMTLEGMGIATVPAAMVKNELRDKQLVELKYHWTPEPLIFQARYNAETASDYVVKAAELAQQITARSV